MGEEDVGILEERNRVVVVGTGGRPLASHEEVVNDSNLFWQTLKTFHSLMATKCMVPIIGGKELDLHLLYVQVTRRGGYNQVVSEKKWREVSGVFEFSPTTTSASYALRKHYFSLLFLYEQLHFSTQLHHQTPPPSSSSSGKTSSSSCMEATGTIDGKFDCGYLVSMKLGSDVFRGVLYHPATSSTTAAAANTTSSPSSSSMAIVPYISCVNNNIPQHAHQEGKGIRMRRRRRKKLKGRGNNNGGDEDPLLLRPKPNRSGYNFFFAEKHSALKSLYPNREREFTKMIASSWNNLTPQERSVYQNYGLQDKERYQKELKEYRERVKMNK